MVSPIVLCLPHLRRPPFTIHRKQEAVCNPLKLEYARLSPTGTVREAYPKHRWTAFVPLCSVLFSSLHSHHILFNFFIFKYFLGHSDQNTFFFLLLPCLPHFLRACLFISTLERKVRKKFKTGCLDDFTVTCAHGFNSTKTTRRSRFIAASALVYTFFLLSCSSRGPSLLYVLHWAGVTTGRNRLVPLSA